SRGDANGLDDAQAGVLPDRRDPLRCLTTVKLKQARTHCAENVIDEFVIGVDHHRDGLDAPGRQLGERARGARREVARAIGEKHEADIVGAGCHRRIEDGRRPHATDFYPHRHPTDSLWLEKVQGSHNRPGWVTLCNPGAQVHRSAALPAAPGRWRSFRPHLALGAVQSAAYRMRFGCASKPSSSFSRRSAWRRQVEASRASARAVRRHFPWPSQVASPPIRSARAKAPGRSRDRGARRRDAAGRWEGGGTQGKTGGGWGGAGGRSSTPSGTRTRPAKKLRITAAPSNRRQARFRRSRSSLPVLKKGTNLSSTNTVSPVRGLRPCLA